MVIRGVKVGSKEVIGAEVVGGSDLIIGDKVVKRDEGRKVKDQKILSSGAECVGGYSRL